MIVEFARFVEGIFPSLDPALGESLRRAALQYGDYAADLFVTQFDDKVSQGDVLEGLVFEIEQGNGELLQQEVPGMMLSPSCDFDNDPTVVFAPCYPWSWFETANNASSIEVNEISNRFYLPRSGRRAALVVDFSVIQAFRSDYIRAAITANTVRKIESFTVLGWWLLIAKLALHFLRPEKDNPRGAAVPSLGARIEIAFLEFRSLLQYVFVGRR